MPDKMEYMLVIPMEIDAMTSLVMWEIMDFDLAFMEVDLNSMMQDQGTCNINQSVGG